MTLLRSKGCIADWSDGSRPEPGPVMTPLRQ